MEYIKISIVIKPYNEDVAQILIAQMGEFGFESFCENNNGFDAFIIASQYNEKLIQTLNPLIDGIKYEYTTEKIADQNWNKTWEDNFFTPINIDNKCYIRSTLHPRNVDIENEIIINPKMSFGTGHHETTCMMIRFILENKFENKKVLDMGCGTGILGILASKRGAKIVDGIDVDEWCYNNTLENIKLNNIKNMNVAIGNANSLEDKQDTYDIILANINRNILLNDMQYYVKSLVKNGLLAMSGFYTEDISLINKCAQNLGLTPIGQKIDNNWTMLSYIKQ